MAILTFGKNPTGERLERVRQSPHYRDGAFHNLEPTPLTLQNGKFLKALREYWSRPPNTQPSGELPVVKTDLRRVVSEEPVIVWLGHSSYFIRSRDFSILVDPVLCGYAAPFSFMGRSFPGTDFCTAQDLPDVDLLILTHDHYDHLDHDTMLHLRTRTKRVVTPLGVGSHLEYWGFEPDKITELDWWEDVSITDEVHITAAPSRHFSGRGVFRRNQTLWASFVLKLHGHRLYLGGDSGYHAQFSDIGRQFGPFDLALLDSAQYHEAWPHVHMAPEQTVQAAVDLDARVLLPVHWGKFTLSMHPWNEPVERVLAAADEVQLPVTTPRIGQVCPVGGELCREVWWVE